MYATISDTDSMGKTEPKEDSAILQPMTAARDWRRKFVLFFDFTESYWETRIRKPQQSYTILRNIFVLPPAEGKSILFFVKPEDAMLSEETLSTFVETNQKFGNINISQMFDFKYKEDVEECFSQLKIRKLPQTDNSFIYVKSADDLIDLSPCIEFIREAMFFESYEIDAEIKLWMHLNPGIKSTLYKGSAR